MGCDAAVFCLFSQGDFGMSAPPDVHNSRDRRPTGVRVRQGLSVPGKPRLAPARVCVTQSCLLQRSRWLLCHPLSH